MNLEKLGIMLRELREEKGLSQSELCRGVCKKKDLSKIELGERVIDAFWLDCFLSRLGKSVDKLEFILTEKDYFFYEMREKIEEALQEGKVSLIKEFLKNYEKNLKEKYVLHWQYIDMVKALLFWETSEKECVLWLEKAIERTLPFIREKDIWNLAMGRDELMLLILWGEKKKQGKRRIAFMQKALTYMEKQWKDIEEKGKIYPYAAMLLERELIKEKLWQEAEKVGEDAVKLLIDIDSICYLRELLQLQIFVKNELGKTEEAKKFTEEYMILEDICKEYGYIDEKTGILVRLKKQFYVEKEVIRKNRIGRGFTQEQLSEGICEPETLARIEKGRRAHERNFGKLTERLGWRKEKRSTELAIWDFKKLEKKWKIDWLMGHRKFKEARKELELFECGDTLEGRQYLLYMKTMVRVQLGELTYQEALEVFGEALSLTLKNYEKLSFKEYILTRQEMVILNGIALAHIEIGEKERGIEIYEDVLTGCDQSSVKNQHRTTGVLIFMENLPVYLEEMKRYEEALEWHEKAIRLVLKCRRGLLLDKILANKAYVWEKQGRKEEACLQLYKQAYYISILMEDKVIGSGIREHCQKQYGEETWARVISGENNF